MKGFADSSPEEEGTVFVIAGAPFHSTASFRPGARFAPLEIRKASYNFETYNLEAGVDLPSGFEPIPVESPRYSSAIDLNQDGLISAGEFMTARFAATLDASDPSLYFGEPLQVRLGMEFSF